MKLPSRSAAILLGAAIFISPSSANAQQLFGSASQRLPFTATLSNTRPLVFGMGEEDAARALGTPLTYISGRPGDEIFLTFRNIGGSGFFNRQDRLYLQFRRGRLTGWKGDWGQNWMWQ
jgi:hypothetical protein